MAGPLRSDEIGQAAPIGRADYPGQLGKGRAVDYGTQPAQGDKLEIDVALTLQQDALKRLAHITERLIGRMTPVLGRPTQPSDPEGADRSFECNLAVRLHDHTNQIRACASAIEEAYGRMQI